MMSTLKCGNVFDRHLLKTRRNRIAPHFDSYAFLKERVAADLISRLKHIRRSFQTVVDLGSHTGQLSEALQELHPKTLITTDLSETMVRLALTPIKIVVNEEALPFAPGSLDLLTSALTLHWVNDLPGLLAQISQALKPDGLFLAALLGGETLKELRDCLTTAEYELKKGITPRFSPTISLNDAGALLQRAGFALPVTDIQTIQTIYPDPLALLKDLKGMGESNALNNRSKAPLPRAILGRMVELYQERYALPDGRIPATFEIITLTGWRPHSSQPQPLKRGSATTSLADTL